MLVTPKFQLSLDPIHRVINTVIGRGSEPEVYGKGLLILTNWNPEFVIDPNCFHRGYEHSVELNPRSILSKKKIVKGAKEKGITEDNEWVLRMDTDADPLKIFRNYRRPLRKVKNDWEDSPRTLYLDTSGVCDSPEQLLDIYDFEKDERNLFICFVEIRRDEQTPDGGWRYHKWGEYVGTQDPQHEYIYDDKHIEKVYTYSVYEMKPEANSHIPIEMLLTPY